MIAPGIVLVFLGYSLGSWGYCMVRGWDITLRQWMSPVNPWTWPAGDIQTVPPGQVFPGGPAGGFAGIGQGTQAIGNAAQQAAQSAQQVAQGGGQEGQVSPWSQIGNAAIQAGNAASGQ